MDVALNQRDLARKSTIADRVNFLRGHFVDPYLKDLAALGLLKKEEKLRSDFEALLKTFERILILHNSGESFGSIGRTVSLPTRTVESWIKGEHIPLLLMRGERELRKKQEFSLNIPRGESPLFAYFLGTYCGSVRPGHAIYHFRPQVTHQGIAKKIARAFNTVVESKARIIERDSQSGEHTWHGYEVNCLSLPLSRHMNTVTRSNQRVPWEHLETERERLAFLQGVFDIRSSVSTGGSGFISLQRTGGEHLIVELAHALMQVGIIPRVRTGDKATLFINELNDLREFEERIGYSDRTQRARLKQLTSREVSRTGYRSADYERAKTYWNEHPELNNKQISDAIGVPRDAIQSWRKKGREPNEVIRKRDLLSLLSSHEHDVDLSAFLYRKCGLSTIQCAEIAKCVTLREAQAFHHQMTTVGLNPETNPEMFINLLMRSFGKGKADCELDNLSVPSETFHTEADEGAPLAGSEEELGDPISIMRRDMNHGHYQNLYFIEPLKNLVERAPQLSYPCFTFEKFLDEAIKKEEHNLARMLIIASVDKGLSQIYQAFLSDSGALPKELN